MTMLPKIGPPPDEAPKAPFERSPVPADQDRQITQDANALLEAAKKNPIAIPQDVIERGARSMAASGDHTNRVGDRAFELFESAGVKPDAIQDVVRAYDRATLARAAELSMQK